MYNPVEIILKKRNGAELSREELKFFIEAFIDKKIPEYQMSSLLMAIFFQSMTPEEVQILTEVYINSGKQISFPQTMNTVDKHSTGGVGDKISLMLSPIVVACGGKIPMISGRGLGHTGGTLDKLEAIPGFRTDYSEAEFKKIIEKIGFSIISQSQELVPADKVIYALRDVSGTVESLPLITASIMSKKIAEGAQNLVIDLKVGTGAFIKNMEQAKKLGFLLKQTGEKLGQQVSIIFSNMNSPLGENIGNALEIIETIDYLKGKNLPDIHELTKTLAVEMLILAKTFTNRNDAEKKVEEVIADGSALKIFRDFIEAQGGNPACIDDYSLFATSKFSVPIISPKTGWVESINSQSIGYALIDVGAGRMTLDSKLNYGTGAKLHLKIGDKVESGSSMGTLFCDNKEIGIKVAERISSAYQIVNILVEKEKLILDKM